MLLSMLTTRIRTCPVWTGLLQTLSLRSPQETATGRCAPVRSRSTTSSSEWVRRQNRDVFVDDARAAGYRSRAALKLEQMDKRFRLFKHGDVVIDLGCAPGGWTQVAVKRVRAAGGFVCDARGLTSSNRRKSAAVEEAASKARAKLDESLAQRAGARTVLSVFDAAKIEAEQASKTLQTSAWPPQAEHAVHSGPLRATAGSPAGGMRAASGRRRLSTGRDQRLGRVAGSTVICDDPKAFGVEADPPAATATAAQEGEALSPGSFSESDGEGMVSSVWLDSDGEDEDEVLPAQRRRSLRFAQAEAGGSGAPSFTSMQSRTTAGEGGTGRLGGGHLGRGVAPGGVPLVGAASLTASLADELLGVRPRGRVVAVDLLPVQGVWGAGIVQGNFGDGTVRRALRALLPGGQADVILSDMAHHFTGDSETDTAIQTQLARQAAHFACGTRAEAFDGDGWMSSAGVKARPGDASLDRPVLKRGGNLVLKLRGVGEPAVNVLLSGLGGLFSRCVVDKPEASRAGSAEVFAVCLGYKGRRLAAAAHDLGR